MTKTRIALFSATLGGGGAERVITTLANGFHERGYLVDVVLVKRHGSYLRDLAPGIEVIDLAASRALVSLWPLVGYLRRARPDAVLSAQGHVNMIAIWAHLLARTSLRLVTREANTASVSATSTKNWRVKLVSRLRRRFYLLCDRVVAPSRGVANDLIHVLGIPAEHVEVIANPLSLQKVRQRSGEELAHAWFAPASPPVILGIGRLTAQKDFATLIRAFGKVVTERRARLMILGEGEDRGALQELVASLGLCDRVSMPGFVGNPFNYMRQAAVYVLSSRWEGLPNALLEAMAVATPVVATDCPSGPREILDGGRWGSLITVGDVDAMASAIIAALDGPTKTMPLSLLEERYGADAVVDRYLSLLAASNA